MILTLSALFGSAISLDFTKQFGESVALQSFQFVTPPIEFRLLREGMSLQEWQTGNTDMYDLQHGPGVKQWARDDEKRKFAGAVDAVWAHKSWLLFTKVNTAPTSEITSPIWHIGWGGGENMKETYQKQVESGTKFQTPITDISDQCDGKGGNGRFFFSYIDGPDHALIELNTTAANVTYFGHVHLLSEDPMAAAEWYVKEFGLRRRGQDPPSRELRYRCGRQTGPSVGLMMDEVSIIIYPVGNAKAAFPDAWKGREGLESSKGHTIDHLGFSVDNLDQTLGRLKRDGVKVTDEPRSVFDGKIRFAFIEGPDHIRIEVLEDHTANE